MKAKTGKMAVLPGFWEKESGGGSGSSGAGGGACPVMLLPFGGLASKKSTMAALS